MSDRLAEIEERALRKQANCDDVLGEGYEPAASFRCRDVLALVEVAKAARPCADWTHITKQDADTLRAALSALDGEA